METLENDELSDRELDTMLGAWKTPDAPARLRTAVFPESRAPWWRASVRVPVPVACALAVVPAAAAWLWMALTPPRVVIRTERIEVPVVKQVPIVQKEVVTRTVYRDRAAFTDLHELRPVAELRPRIIRSKNDQN
jgi:hypothetical protein